MDHRKIKRVPEKHILCFLDCVKAFDCVDHNKLEHSERYGDIRPPDLPLEKPVCRSQEATVRTGHGTTDWFEIGKGVGQVCILSPCLFKLYAEYILRYVGPDEHKLDSKLLGETSTISDMQVIPL